ncbi:hypothetical protein [Singulisphaera sp. PoT]|uniref:hypothetical protein n=1 Tax=Singulisphaera sp. PoT TaxID=3411797 RepID=UPI003BF5F6E1
MRTRPQTESWPGAIPAPGHNPRNRHHVQDSTLRPTRIHRPAVRGGVARWPLALPACRRRGPPAAGTSPAAGRPEGGPAGVGATKFRLEKALDQYLEETEERLRIRMDGLKGFFEARKEGAPLFASAVLDLGAKGRLAGSFLESFATQAGRALGLTSGGDGPDGFTLFVRRAFSENVLDRGAAVREMQRALAGFREDLVESEARLLVSLGVDVPDDAIARGLAMPDLRHELAALDLCDAMIAEGVDGASTDLGASLGMFVVSNFLGDQLAKRATPEDASRPRQFGTNIAAGIAVEAALGEGVKAMGYDPEKALANRTRAGIDNICTAVIEGDNSMGAIYPTLSIFRRSHPDAAVRLACQRADEAVTRASNLGLRERLRWMRNERYRSLWKSLMTHLIGPEAASSPLLMYIPLDAGRCSPPDQIIRWAESIVGAFGASN